MDFIHLMKAPLDYVSICEKLGEIEDGFYYETIDEYYMDYLDQFNELSCLASELSNELEDLLSRITWSWSLPPHKNDAFWFNTVSALIDETDIMLLVENEGCYDPDDENTERQKRIRAVKTLTKEQMTNLFSEVYNFLMRYTKLLQAYEMMHGLVVELRELHSFRQRDGIPQLPTTAYIE